jgi:hypothetical protein
VKRSIGALFLWLFITDWNGLESLLFQFPCDSTSFSRRRGEDTEAQIVFFIVNVFSSEELISVLALPGGSARNNLTSLVSQQAGKSFHWLNIE